MNETEKQADEHICQNIDKENLRRASDVYSKLAPAIYGRDPIVNAVCLKLQSRSALGIEKYGTTLANSKEDRLAFLHHAQQEALDLANYLEVLIQKENDNGNAN